MKVAGWKRNRIAAGRQIRGSGKRVCCRCRCRSSWPGTKRVGDGQHGVAQVFGGLRYIGGGRTMA